MLAGVDEGLADADQRTGGWRFLYGVGCGGTFTLYRDASGSNLRSSFGQRYPGAGSVIGASGTAKNDPPFLDARRTDSGSIAGAGGGDLVLHAASPARAIVPVGGGTMACDLDGLAGSGVVCAASA